MVGEPFFPKMGAGFEWGDPDKNKGILKNFLVIIFFKGYQEYTEGSE